MKHQIQNEIEKPAPAVRRRREEEDDFKDEDPSFNTPVTTL
jgi:hypothetical protein